MKERQYLAAAERLETIHKQFSTMVLMLVESFTKMETYLESYATSFEANLNSYHQTTELLHSYADSLRQLTRPRNSRASSVYATAPGDPGA